MKELGSEVVRQPEGEVARQAKGSQPTQPNPNPDHDRTRRPVLCPQRGAPRSQEIETRSFREEAVKHDRRKPVVCSERALQIRSLVTARTSIWKKKQITRERRDLLFAVTNHERSLVNEVDIDFRIPGLRHSVVKQAENYCVRELVKQIENHPHRQSLQRDLQQNNAYNPFSTTSKKMMKDVVNLELFELFKTDPKHSAEHAEHTGVKASSIAPAGIS